MQGFDSKVAQSVTHTIYPTLLVKNHTESLILLFITMLGHHTMIFSCP